MRAGTGQRYQRAASLGVGKCPAGGRRMQQGGVAGPLSWRFLCPIIAPMNDTAQRPALPDRLSVDPRSPHYVAAIFEHDIGIKLNDKEFNNVSEYCISEGWIKIPAGRALDRKGNPMLTKLKGRVEPFYR